MDFVSVLHTAQGNDQGVKQKSVNYYKTSFAPPKKEQRDKKLSVNIQKFLARKEEEEQQKKLEDDLKKQKLLALRNQDKKSLKRVQSMLKRTKSANKSVMEDAVDNVNTAVTLNGPLQPDEDDYGYVSKDAEELYNKLVNKYSNMPPDEPKFLKKKSKSSSDILSTKDRVKAALQRGEDEKYGPKKRKRKSKTDEDGEQSDEESQGEPEENEKTQKTDKFRIPKKIRNPAPALDFESLLKLAEQKQYEPIAIEKNVDNKPDRPMTAKEKQEYLREKERKMRREGLLPPIAPKNDEIPAKKATKSNSGSIKKQSPDDNASTSSSKSVSFANENPAKKMKEKEILAKTKPSTVPCDVKKIKTNESASQSKSSAVTSNKNIVRNRIESDSPNRSKPVEPSRKPIEMNRVKQEQRIPSSSQYDQAKKQKQLERPLKSTNSGLKASKLPESYSKSSISSRPQANSQSSVRQSPPPDVRPSQSKKMIMKREAARPSPFERLPKDRNLMKRRKVIESDDEYDSEMDDFIDDSEAQTDVSSCIKEIFGYDRSRFSRYDEDDDDDECMESNFSELQKEEFISTKHGILEDLADIRRTKLEKDRLKKRLNRR